jgi:hypothetical protein
VACDLGPPVLRELDRGNLRFIVRPFTAAEFGTRLRGRARVAFELRSAQMHLAFLDDMRDSLSRSDRAARELFAG